MGQNEEAMRLLEQHLVCQFNPSHVYIITEKPSAYLQPQPRRAALQPLWLSQAVASINRLRGATSLKHPPPGSVSWEAARRLFRVGGGGLGIISSESMIYN